MNIFFSTTTNNFEKHADRYFKIRRFFLDNGHLLVHDWLNTIKKNNDKYVIPKKLSADEYRKAIDAIDMAELLVFESTLPSFSTGHLMTVALEKKIPTLVMWLDDSPWENRLGMIESIRSEYLELSSYNNKNYKDVLSCFINKYNKNGIRHRFNLVIDDIERQYLDWSSYNTFKSRTAIIRELIRDELNNNEEYKKYLAKRK